MLTTEVIKQEALPEVDVGSRFTVDPKEEKLVELGTYLQKRLQKFRDLNERSQWEQDKAFAFNYYHMIPKDRPLPFAGAANFCCPLPRIGVDAFHANVMSSLYANDNLIQIAPSIIQKDYASTAKKAADYMTYVMNHEAESYLAMDDADKKAQMFGVGFLEPVYKKEEVWETVDVTRKTMAPDQDPQTGEIRMKEKSETKREKKKKTVFDGVKVNSLPVDSIFVSPFINSLEKAVRDDVVFKVFTISYAEVKDRSKSRDDRPSFYKKSQVEKIKPFISEKIYRQLNELEQARANKDGFYLDLLSIEEQVELAEAHLWWDIDGDELKEEITVTFHPKTGAVLRVSLTPCRIVELIPRPIDERFYGEGIPIICKPISDEWEQFHNTRSNAGQWENTTFGFYRSGGLFNPQQITIQPGHFYPVDDPREVQFAQPPRVGSSYFQEEQMILSYFERIFALDENMQGVGATRRRTATESLKVASRASVRFGNPFNRIVTQFNKLLKHVWELNRECAPEEKEFYVLSEGGAPLFDKMKKYDYSVNMQFGVKVSSVFDQQTTRDSIMMAYRLFLPNPIVQAHPEVIYDLSQKTLDNLNIDIDLPKPPQAKTLSPYEEHELFQRGEDPEPEVGEDYDHHMKIHMMQLNAQNIEDWEPESVKKLIVHIDKTKILKQTIEHFNLNQSGQFTQGNSPPQDKGKPGKAGMAKGPAKPGESGKSMINNANQGGQNGHNLDQVLGAI